MRFDRRVVPVALVGVSLLVAAACAKRPAVTAQPTTTTVGPVQRARPTGPEAGAAGLQAPSGGVGEQRLGAGAGPGEVGAAPLRPRTDGGPERIARVAPPPAGPARPTPTPLSRIHFNFDSAEILPEARRVLEGNAEWLKGHQQARVEVEGHADERGTDEYNLALGERRARAARDYLVQLGIDAGRLTMVSYGEYRPLESGRTEEAYAKNRRAEFVLK